MLKINITNVGSSYQSDRTNQEIYQAFTDNEYICAIYEGSNILYPDMITSNIARFYSGPSSENIKLVTISTDSSNIQTVTVTNNYQVEDVTSKMIYFDNTISELDATNVQDAMDKLMWSLGIY